MSFTFLHSFLFFLELIIVLFPTSPPPPPSQPNFLSICYQSNSELFARVQMSSQHLPRHQKVYPFIFWKRSFWSLQICWYLDWDPVVPSCHLGFPFITFWGCHLFLSCAGFPFPGSWVLFFLVWSPSFGSTAFCSSLRKGVEKQKFCDFPCPKMCLFYMRPWWLFGWVWNSRLEILFLQNFESITPTFSCLQVLVKKFKIVPLLILYMWLISPSPSGILFLVFWNFIMMSLLCIYFYPTCWALGKLFWSENSCPLVLKNFCELFYPKFLLFCFSSFLIKCPFCSCEIFFRLVP